MGLFRKKMIKMEEVFPGEVIKINGVRHVLLIDLKRNIHTRDGEYLHKEVKKYFIKADDINGNITFRLTKDGLDTDDNISTDNLFYIHNLWLSYRSIGNKDVELCKDEFKILISRYDGCDYLTLIAPKEGD